MIFRKLFRKWSIMLSVMVILLCGLPWFLIGTHAGLQTLSFAVKIAMSGKLQLGAVQGRLLDEFSIAELYWQDPNKTIRMEHMHIVWQWRWPVQSPLLKGVLVGKSLQITQDQQAIHMPHLKGEFQGNSVKTMHANIRSTGLFNALPFTTKMTWHEDSIDWTIDAAPNSFHIKGKPSTTVFIKADLPQPALLHPALKKLHTHIRMDGQWKQDASGVFVTTASPGFIQLPQQRLHFDQASFKNIIKAQNIDTTATIKAKDNILRMHMKLLPKVSQWNGEINLSKGPHHLQLEGHGLLKPDISGELRLSAKDFPIIDSNEYTIEASPELKARFTTRQIDIQGDIAIPKALIQPLSFEEGHNVSEDIRFVQAEETPALPFLVSMQINLIPGDQVFLKLKGLNTQLTGTLALHKTVDSPVTARGKLSMTKGKYKAYGQNLDIAQGELIFTGGLLTKPGIQLKAEKKLTDQIIPDSDLQLPNLQNSKLNAPVTVGISVSGWLADPRIKLYAIPGLPEADILSMLLLGYPIHKASKAKAQLLLTLLSSMNKGQGYNLLQKAQEKLDIDVQVKTTSRLDRDTKTLTDSTGILIGKALSKKLYISYNAGLSQTDTNTFTLNWLLNRFFSVQVTASNSGNGIDILYSSSKESEHDKNTVKPNKTS